MEKGSGGKRNSCRKCMNKFKDAIYGKRKGRKNCQCKKNIYELVKSAII
jgi:hypothetical protein